jgi:hypothetical protein
MTERHEKWQITEIGFINYRIKNPAIQAGCLFLNLAR